MKSLKECDLCENVMKLMCLAPALGGTPDFGTKSDAFLAPRTPLLSLNTVGWCPVCAPGLIAPKLPLEPDFQAARL